MSRAIVLFLWSFLVVLLSGCGKNSASYERDILFSRSLTLEGTGNGASVERCQIFEVRSHDVDFLTLSQLTRETQVFETTDVGLVQEIISATQEVSSGHSRGAFHGRRSAAYHLLMFDRDGHRLGYVIVFLPVELPTESVFIACPKPSGGETIYHNRRFASFMASRVLGTERDWD